jgi:hypothetical protein
VSQPAAHYTAPEVMFRPRALSLLWHDRAKTQPDPLIDLGEDAEAKQIVIREMIHWLNKSWPRIKQAATVLSVAIEIGEKLCQKR